jgi:flagellar secretion chaperone FliS
MMMTTGRGAQQYLQTQVRSRTPLELVVMLYDGALRAVTTAAEAAATRDIRTRRDNVSKALGILAELQSTLDREKGGKIAEELDELYGWMTSRLVDATVKQEVKPLNEVKKVLQILHDSWQQIAANPAPAGSATTSA